MGNDAGQACADYRVAFEVATELDAVGANVRRALDSPEVDRLAQQLVDLESSLNDKYPGWGEKVLANDSAAIARIYGSVGVQDIAEFGEAFKKLHEKILLECDFVSLGVNSQSSPEVPDEVWGHNRVTNHTEPGPLGDTYCSPPPHRYTL